jgi:hypothetical protein
MFDLVVWSFMAALTPSALGLGWKLIVGIRDLLVFKHLWELDQADRMGLSCPLNPGTSSISGSMADRTPFAASGPFSAPTCWRAS